MHLTNTNLTKAKVLGPPTAVTSCYVVMAIGSYFDYKGGNIVGMSYNTEEAANSYHIFMLQRLLSSF